MSSITPNYRKTSKSSSDSFRPHLSLRKGSTYKESLGEYGSGWGWDSNTYAHVFDQTASDGTPYRVSNNGTNFNTEKDFCKNEIEITNGQLLTSGSIMTSQSSCRPNTGNVGNYYSWPASTAGGYHEIDGYNEENSICPRGWQLTVNAADVVKSWIYLITKTYSISTSGFNDSSIRYLPMSFIRSGNYNQGSLNNRGSYGSYWSSAADGASNAYRLRFGSGSLDPQNSYYKYGGFSVHCVVR